MSYNIHFTIGTDNVADWKRIAELIGEYNPDLLALEEVTVNHPHTPGLNVPEVLGNELEMHAEFADAIPINDGKGKYGIAALSKYPLERVGKFYLPTPEGGEKRVFLVVKVLAEKHFYFVVTHFPFQGEFPGDEECRVECAAQIMETVGENNWLPTVWAGDFNTYPGSPTIESIHEKCKVFNDADKLTPTAYCKNAGWRQIDFICACPKNTFALKNFRFVENMLASDHRPVIADLAWNM
jgi:endonuclease/exonuclease/phosphatase family metal-dependent hydrolase